MSAGEVSCLSNQDLQVVKNLIERCLQLHMSRKEVVSVLSREANVMPSITELLWQRLEEENPEFFEVYHIRLALKEQINRFNELLRQQAELMRKLQPSGVVPLPVSNGSRVAQFQQNADGYAIDQTRPSIRPESLHPPLAQTLPGSFANGVSPLQTPTPFNLTTPPRALDCLPDTFSNSVRLMHGLNGGVVKSESDYPSNSIFYSAEPNLGEAHGSIEDGSIATYGGLQASSQPLNVTLLDVNGSYGHLGQIPKDFSLPDLPYHNYQNVFMTERENFLNSQDRGELPDENKVAITDSYGTYEEFGSE